MLLVPFRVSNSTACLCVLGRYHDNHVSLFNPVDTLKNGMPGLQLLDSDAFCPIGFAVFECIE
jgi:hypothetical protein